MGYDLMKEARAKMGKVAEFQKHDYGQAATYDIFYYQINGEPSIFYNGGLEMRLLIPPGNYEIEARAPIYNNNEGKEWYTAYLDYWLGTEARAMVETGQIGNTAASRPYNLILKTMACFSESKNIKFTLGSQASSMVFTSFPSVTVKRVGAIRYGFD